MIHALGEPEMLSLSKFTSNIDLIGLWGPSRSVITAPSITVLMLRTWGFKT